MTKPVKPIDLERLKVFPLSQRKNMRCLYALLVAPESDPGPCPEYLLDQISQCADRIRAARDTRAGGVLMYGAHLG